MSIVDELLDENLSDEWAYEFGRKWAEKAEKESELRWDSFFERAKQLLREKIEHEVLSIADAAYCADYTEEEIEEIKEFFEDIDFESFVDSLHEQLLPAFERGFRGWFKEKARCIVESDLETGKGAVTYVFGYYPFQSFPAYSHAYTIYGASSPEEAEEILIRSGVAPHKWKTAPISQDGDWGNYWWVSVTRKNLEEVLSDEDFLAALCAGGEVEFYGEEEG